MTDKNSPARSTDSAKAWSGRFSEPVSELVKRYTASVDFDQRMASQDIRGSLAHARMLARQGILGADDLAAIERGLAQIGGEIERGEFVWNLDDEDVHLELRDRAPTPEEHVEGRETQRLVREGLAALPEDYRRVLVLRELHQLSYAEICEVTELELGTVKSRINRARLLLRNYLAADGNFFEKPASKVTECNQTVGGERNAI